MEKIVAIVGLTSSGKSGLGISLAKRFNGEIVSADSRQVYKGLDYCSGKVSKSEQAEVCHHLLDVCELGEQFSLFDFQQMAYAEIDKILSKNKVPFLVGGTGLYSRAVIEGYSLSQTKPSESLRKDFETLSLEQLIEFCKQNNIEVPSEPTKRRLVRLIEKTDAPQKENCPKYKVLQIGIFWSREEIYKRIEERLKERMPNMLEEIKSLLNLGKSKEFLRSLGLEAKCVVDYLDGKYNSFEEFFEDLFKQERHFAKRQQTWYNKEKNIVWLDAKDNLEEKAFQLIEEFLKSSD